MLNTILTCAMATAPRGRSNPLTTFLVGVGVTGVTFGFIALAAKRARSEQERRVVNGAATSTAQQAAIGTTTSLLMGLVV